MQEKSYEQITVQQIIERADVGRSTFYAHFETRDDLLRALCTDIFEHVFGREPEREQEHDFSNAEYDVERQLAHMLWHLRANGRMLPGLLSGQSREAFMEHFRRYVRATFSRLLNDGACAAPREYALNHVVSSFAETARWWLCESEGITPEQMAAAYMALLPPGLLGGRGARG